jgi:hypothetical protein
MTPAVRLDCVEQAFGGQQAGLDCLDRLAGYRSEVLRICDERGADRIVCGPDVQSMTRDDIWTYYNPQFWNDFDKTHFTNEGHLLIAFALQATLVAHGL